MMARFRYTLNLASLAGLMTYGLFLVYLYAFNANPLGPLKYLSLAAPILLMFYALQRFREMELEGFGTFVELFRPAILFSFVYASLAAMLIYLHGLWLDPAWIDVTKTNILESLGAEKDLLIEWYGKDEYRGIVEMIENQSLGELCLADFQSKSVTSFVIGAIMSLSMRRKRPIFEDHDTDA